MTHNEILKMAIGTRTRETVELGYQCVAWAKKYCEMRGFPIRYFNGSAINGWVTSSPFDLTWRKVYYNGFNSPSEGDVIFWSEDRCKDGHVAIANKYCFPFLFRYTDQNGGGNEEYIQPRWSSGKNVVGWFTRNK